jgi:hypothetical protein
MWYEEQGVVEEKREREEVSLAKTPRRQGRKRVLNPGRVFFLSPSSLASWRLGERYFRFPILLRKQPVNEIL